MTDDADKLYRQLAAARQFMDQYPKALSALAGDDEVLNSADFQRRMTIARQGMKKYRSVYRKLAE